MKLKKELINSQKLEDWISRKKNILLMGERGVGKTACVFQALNKLGLKFLYLPGSTADPYLDFVGLPKIKETEDGGLDLLFVHRKELEEIDYLFIDEYNRAPKKVRNGCMEIIQFKTINGQPLPKLKGVICAINPQDQDDSYDVEDLDKAQFDRFHIKCQVPYDVCENYMTKTFGEELATIAIVWWKGLSKEVQAKVSPRNLDYALVEYIEGGDLMDVFDPNDKALMSSVSVLSKQLSSPPITVLLKQVYDKQDKKKAKSLMTDDSHRHQAHEVIRENPDYMDFFLPYYPKEIMAKSILETEFLTHIVNNFGAVKEYSDVIIDYVKTNPDAEESKRVREIISKKNVVLEPAYEVAFANTPSTSTDQRFYKLNNTVAKPLTPEVAEGLLGKLNFDGRHYTKNSDRGDDFELYTINYINKVTAVAADNTKLWNKYIEYIPTFDKIKVEDALKGLEFMEKLSVKPNDKDNTNLNSNFFDDSHTASLFVFNTFLAVVMTKTGINKTELSTLYPELMKNYNFFVTDAEVGFPEIIPVMFLQET